MHTHAPSQCYSSSALFRAAPYLYSRRYRYYSSIMYTRTHLCIHADVNTALVLGDRNGWPFEVSKNKETRQIACRPVAINHTPDTREIFLVRSYPILFLIYTAKIFFERIDTAQNLCKKDRVDLISIRLIFRDENINFSRLKRL